jgi:hypothetical protein
VVIKCRGVRQLSSQHNFFSVCVLTTKHGSICNYSGRRRLARETGHVEALHLRGVPQVDRIWIAGLRGAHCERCVDFMPFYYVHSITLQRNISLLSTQQRSPYLRGLRRSVRRRHPRLASLSNWPTGISTSCGSRLNLWMRHQSQWS